MVLCGCINNGSKQKYDGDDDDVYYYIRWLYIFFSGSEKPALEGPAAWHFLRSSRIEVEMPRYTHGVIYIKNHDVRQDGQQPKGDRQGYQSSLGIACRAIVQGFVFLNLARAFLMACGLASLVLVLITLYLLRIFTPGLSCNVCTAFSLSSICVELLSQY